MARGKSVVETAFPDEEVVIEAPEIGLDDLFSMEVNLEEQKQVQAALLIAQGTYLKVDEATFTRKKMEDVPTLVKNEEGEYEESVLPSRDIIRLFARLQDKEGKPARLGFGVSWQPVYKEGRDGVVRPDSATKLYAQAVKVYQKASGEEKVSVGQVINFLVEEPYKVFVIQTGTRPDDTGEPGNFVTTISKA